MGVPHLMGVPHRRFEAHKRVWPPRGRGHRENVVIWRVYRQARGGRRPARVTPPVRHAPRARDSQRTTNAPDVYPLQSSSQYLFRS